MHHPSEECILVLVHVFNSVRRLGCIIARMCVHHNLRCLFLQPTCKLQVNEETVRAVAVKAGCTSCLMFLGIWRLSGVCR